MRVQSAAVKEFDFMFPNFGQIDHDESIPQTAEIKEFDLNDPVDRGEIRKHNIKFFNCGILNTHRLPEHSQNTICPVFWTPQTNEN